MLDALPGRGAGTGGVRLHIDRRFSIRGAGTVVTGTLWSGAIGRGDALHILPQGAQVRVRGVQVHDEPVTIAHAGQRVAVNLVGARLSDVARGDVLVDAGTSLAPTFRVDAALEFADPDLAPEHSQRVQVHHGTREAPARLSRLGGRFWQIRLEAPLLAAAGDRLVVRSIASPYTLGGGVVLDAGPARHGPTRDVIARLTRIARGEPAQPEETDAPAAAGPRAQRAAPEPLSEAALGLEARLREAWFEPPLQSSLSPAERGELPALRAAGRAVRAGPALHYHPDALAEIEQRLRAIVEREGAVTLARLRDELGTSRKFAQALLEHFDAARVTRRLPTDERVLRR
jgi:selenocysteine-specific elongation factor